MLFLRLRDLGAQPAPEQARRRERLQASARAAAEAWPADARIVLESADGLAIVGRGDPCQALEAARKATHGAPDPALGIALHHGAITTVRSESAGARIGGEGVETAAAIAGLATGGSVLASLPFREAIAAAWPPASQAFRPAGEFVDGQQQSHRLYAWDAATARSLAQRRRILGLAGVGVLLGAGAGVRLLRAELEAARRPAVIVLDIRPSGTVYIDGESKGVSPPMTRIAIPPGPHVIEIRNARFKPLQMDVHLNPGEEMQLRHVFAAPQRRAPPAPPARKPDFFDKLRDMVNP